MTEQNDTANAVQLIAELASREAKINDERVASAYQKGWFDCYRAIKKVAEDADEKNEKAACVDQFVSFVEVIQDVFSPPEQSK